MCVIGGGPVGLSVARRVAESGRSVVLLERGGLVAQPQSASDDVGFDARAYGGATSGRAYGIGGTSALWGGQLLPIMEHELDGSLGSDRLGWPIRIGDVGPYYSILDRWLNIDASPFEVGGDFPHPIAGLDWTGFAPRYSKWIHFGRRHMWTAWKKDLLGNRSLRIWLNCRVTGMMREGRRIHRVIACGSHARMIVSTQRVVLAAGAIESTRLALAMFDSPEMIASRPAALGSYLHDHLSLRVARIETIRHGRMRSLFSPVFRDGVMRTLRIEATSENVRSGSLPSAYAHIVAEADPGSGFAIARDVLRALQRGRPSDALRSFARVPAAMPELVEMAFWRIARSRLVAPERASLHLHVDFQQTPDVRNRIYLAQDRDPDGCRRVRIDWRVFDDVAHWISQIEPHLRVLWHKNHLERAALLKFYERPAAAAFDLSNGYDIFHPAGTTRMGLDPESGCVDRDLLLFGTENLFIASTSVFPSLGAANPTYTAMALGIRLADHLV